VGIDEARSERQPGSVDDIVPGGGDEFPHASDGFSHDANTRGPRGLPVPSSTVALTMSVDLGAGSRHPQETKMSPKRLAISQSLGFIVSLFARAV
jgi:hypothetical protein